MRWPVLLAALLAAAPARAGIGPPAWIGAATAAAGTGTTIITTSVDCPAGSMIVVATGAGGPASVPSSVTDSAHNTYTALTAYGGSGVPQYRTFYVPPNVDVDLPVMGTITITYSNTTNSEMATAACVSGIQKASPADQDVGANGTNTTPTVTTGTLANAAEIVFEEVIVSSGASDGYTEDSHFMTLTGASRASNIIRWAYRITTTTAAVTGAPTLGTSRTWGESLSSFIGAPVAVGTGGLMLMGVGS